MRRRRAPAKATATRAVVYVRVSTEQQADEGVSLAAQRERCLAYAKALELDVVEVIEDAGVSAKSLDRPGLQRALAMLDACKADALLVAKLDRLTRRVADLGHLVDEHFASRSALLSVGDNIDTRSASGRLVLNVLASVSQWEREAIGERTSAAMRHMRREGRYTGGAAPYGFTLAEGKLAPVPHEQAVIARARELRAAGCTFASVAVQLAEDGHRSRTGAPFAPMQVARLVREERAA